MRVWPLLLLTACPTQPYFPEERPANACDAGAFGSEELGMRFRWDEKSRGALLYFPAGPGPHDVIVNLHELKSDPRRQAHYSGWVEYAREQNAILVAADGKAATWNAGQCCGRAREQAINDVSFLNELMRRVDEVACTSGNVLVTGIGNGGMMAEAWACESDVPDAVVSVGGSLQVPTCRKAERAIPYFHYHGERDTFFPAAGNAEVRSLDTAKTEWAKRNGGTPNPFKDGELDCVRYEGGQAPTTFCTVLDAVDTWPGAEGAKVEAQSPLGSATSGPFPEVKAFWSKPAAPAQAAPPVEAPGAENGSASEGQSSQ